MRLSDDPERQEFLKNRNKPFFKGKDGKNYLKLRRKLLSIAGTEIYIQSDPDLLKLLKYGKVIHARTIKIVDGEPNRCHYNSALFWLEDRVGFKIVIGWALVEDGLWYQHTFCWSPNTKEIIDNGRGKIYWGYVLDNKESIRFLFSNVQDRKFLFQTLYQNSTLNRL
jgi:hypothetical protein